MNLNSDDPKLTAYALGELEGKERTEVETLLADNPKARQWVEEVRKTATQLEGELCRGEVPQLNSEQVGAIEAELALREQEAKEPKWQPAESPQRKPFLWRPLIEALAVVAILATIAAMFLPALAKSKRKAQKMAQREELRAQNEDLNQLAPPPSLPVPQPAPQSVYEPNRQRPASRPTSLDGDDAFRRGGGVSEQEETFRRRYATPSASAFNASSRFSTESYSPIADNGFLAVPDNPLSTFSIDVDTASYSMVRRFLNQRQLPPRDAVRIEEMVNYFPYNYRRPTDRRPFAANVEIASCPWNEKHRLVRIGLKGREVANDKRPPGNLVFLVDVSGSMQARNKLPLVKQSLRLLVQQLTESDRVSLVVYAGKAGEVLPSTSGNDKRRILDALDRLEAGGSTHGSQGIQLAYRIATENFIPGGVNRVILCTDGDFNVGVTSPGELLRLIEDKAKSGVLLTVLGFGMGNYKDSTVEMLADKGNGNYAYIDTIAEGQKVLVDQMSGTLVTIAKDVKIQVEFNPAQASAYRLVGYENRLLNKEDFNNDQKDAGDIGAGHTVTALYEVVPVGVSPDAPGVDPLKYQRPMPLSRAAESDELLTLKLRYKEPDGETSKLMTAAVTDAGRRYAQASQDFKFASAVAAFGMVLRDSPYKGTASFDSVWELAREGQGRDAEGYREEFLKLVESAKAIQGRSR
ncbi:MAG TPA: von Willebrand factor type A domain-containing protein [Verrucomicrobiae bacterium]|nr:von Willebrand factor type A domain-containing protein [Verrucomicrobiae bacterium]